MFRNPNQEISSELKQLIYKNNAVFVFACSIIILLTNLFWIVFDINKHGFEASVTSIRFIVIALVVIVSLVVAILLYPRRKNDAEFIHKIMMLYVPVIGIETTVLSITKNMAAFELGQPYNGIALSSLYLFAYVFIPFVKIEESLFVILPVITTVFVPAFASGNESYNITINAIMGLSVVFGYFAFRNITITMQRNGLQIDEERSKYMVLTRQSLETIAATIDAKNVYLKGHSKRVALYAQDIATDLGLSDADISKLYFCGLLHDIGKISVSSAILDKPGRLTDEEFKTIKTHTVAGYEILTNLNVYPELRECARYHHERYDGKGYPDGLSSSELSLFIRIISAADAYDAMTSKRSYRDALDRDYVYNEFEKGKGGQFDPVVASAVQKRLNAGEWYHFV